MLAIAMCSMPTNNAFLSGITFSGGSPSPTFLLTLQAAFNTMLPFAIATVKLREMAIRVVNIASPLNQQYHDDNRRNHKYHCKLARHGNTSKICSPEKCRSTICVST